MDVDADFDTRLRVDDVAFTDRDATLLRAIDDAGSLNRAAERLGRSYARSHERLKELETAFGDLVDRERGGSSGGGSTLTERAHDVLARFDRLREGYSSVAEAREAVLRGTVTDRTGELGIIETDAGTIRGIVPPAGGTVEVSIRADAVTLHEPGESPPPSSTSARNRFEGTVTAIDRGEAISHVSIDIGAEEPLFALVTGSSRRRLALEPGTAVLASFKATATRATPVS